MEDAKVVKSGSKIKRRKAPRPEWDESLFVASQIPLEICIERFVRNVREKNILRVGTS